MVLGNGDSRKRKTSGFLRRIESDLSRSIALRVCVLGGLTFFKEGKHISLYCIWELGVLILMGSTRSYLQE